MAKSILSPEPVPTTGISAAIVAGMILHQMYEGASATSELHKRAKHLEQQIERDNEQHETELSRDREAHRLALQDMERRKLEAEGKGDRLEHENRRLKDQIKNLERHSAARRHHA